jgi:hypothetical protein
VAVRRSVEAIEAVSTLASGRQVVVGFSAMMAQKRVSPGDLDRNQ